MPEHINIGLEVTAAENNILFNAVVSKVLALSKRCVNMLYKQSHRLGGAAACCEMGETVDSRRWTLIPSSFLMNPYFLPPKLQHYVWFSTDIIQIKRSR
jgi:hypothetical protein